MKEKFKIFKRGIEIDFPLLLHSQRLRRFFAEVWKALPQQDRDQLNDSLILVSDHAVLRLLANEQDEQMRGGAACWGEGRLYIFLNASALKNKTSEHVRFVIAHELAHVYLKHTDRKGTEQRHENEANRQAAAWKFPLPD